jgi:N-acetylmuramoyl-L-alanine amidase
MLMIVQSLSFSFANKFLETEVVELVDGKDGSTGEYTVVNLMLDGDDVFADVPAVLYTIDGMTRTLVPISFITKKIGADIYWNGDTKEVTINHEGKEIILQIESSTALVDGKSYDLPNGVPAKLMAYEGNYRTMVPVNFVSQHLGYEIFWIGDTRTVSINRPKQTLTAVRYNDSGTYPELRFKVSGEVSLSSLSIDGKSVGGDDSIVLEFFNTELDLLNPPKNDKFVINDLFQEVYDVTITQESLAPMKVKAVVDLGYYRNGEISYDESTGEMVVQLINSVNYVDVEKVSNATTVIVDTTESPAYNVTRLSDRVYVDVIHSKLIEENNTIEVNEGGIESVVYTQVDDDDTYDVGTRYTRIAVNLEEGVSSDNVYIEDVDSKLFIYVQESLYGTYDYARNLEKGTGLFELNLAESGTYNVAFDEASRKLSFVVPKADVNLIPGDDQRDDGLIKSISIKETDSNFNVEIVLSENTTYTAATSNTANLKISFNNERLKDSIYKDMLVVIDAGHGGHDPGATNSNIYEKDIALKSALMLKKKLENEGFKVYMTRERDNYVKLYDRSGIANQLNADLFISIHINAAKNTNAHGMETLYDPDPTRNNKALADAIQNELIRKTGATNRGTVKRPDLVVTRETEMDAVLVELGFVSNPSDLANLLNDAYLEKCAEAMRDGIIEFID